MSCPIFPDDCDDCGYCVEVGFCECHDCWICGSVVCSGHKWESE